MKDVISLAHGEGGELTHRLIEDLFANAFCHHDQLHLDAAVVTCEKKEIAVTTDSFVVKPIFFPGGDIGKLSVAGTVNDLAVSGASPLFLTAGFILEEGFEIRGLKKVVQSMAEEAKHAGVRIIAGDTKVVEKGEADGLFINTTGFGVLGSKKVNGSNVKEGDVVICSGTIGDHGIAIVSAREKLGLLTEVQSDCASLNHMIDRLLSETDGIRIMRDPTRGGLATTLVELCDNLQMTVELQEREIPVKREVEGACDILGFDPLYLANEGKVVIIADATEEERILEILGKDPLGRQARTIGEVTSVDKGKLLLKTPVGTTRRMDRLSGMLLPRIC
ncbi:hydrogenase expression/formation protein HypE [Alteribacter aurantiacus]|uniref:hydrogenase expression/formation protein HypE n=1 Tax=Alteribacter aurantiacus TaxID=254410 RepID=UPI00040B3B13|nr:hydrogenase expression/formation protein HypE [Alteribacter aurantiacus]